MLRQRQFIEITLRYGCSPVNMLHIFRTSFPKNTSRGLLLKESFKETPSKKNYSYFTNTKMETRCDYTKMYY